MTAAPTSGSEDPLIGVTIGGRFRVEKRLAAGAWRLCDTYNVLRQMGNLSGVSLNKSGRYGTSRVLRKLYF